MSLPVFLPAVSLPALFAIPLVVLLPYTVFGATGFGSSILSVPLLAHWLPLAVAVPLITTIDCVAATNAGIRQWRYAALHEIKRLLPAMLLGIALGVTLLVNLPRDVTLFALGIFVAGYGVYVLIGRLPWRSIRPRWALAFGFAGGVFSALFGTGGPIYMVYLAARIEDKTALRATSSLVIGVNVLIRFVVFVAAGLLLKTDLLLLAACLMPIMLLGYWLGNRLHFALSRRGVMRIIAALLFGNGILLLLRAF